MKRHSRDHSGYGRAGISGFISTFISKQEQIMPANSIPEGYHSLTPYLVVPGVAKLISFVKQAFDAKETMPPMTRPDGAVMHAELRIGDSMLMMGEPMGEFKPMPASLYLYVDDVDAV